MDGRATATHLFRLALETFLCLVRPPPGKGRLPRVEHTLVKRVHAGVLGNLGLDGHCYCPPAVGRMPQVLHQRTVLLFPAIEALVAQEANHIVGVVWERPEHESGLCELGRQTCQIQ